MVQIAKLKSMSILISPPVFTIRDIQYSVDESMFLKAEGLFKQRKVGKISETPHGYMATVQGTSLYAVSLSRRHIDQGYCDCYMGQNDELCKHMLALGIAVLHLSGKVEDAVGVSPDNLDAAKQLVAKGMRKIKTYDGPSKIWFSYQRELDVGAACIVEGVQGLPPTKEHAKYLWSLVLKLSNKLAYDAIDDSNGTVGNCISTMVAQCGRYAKEKPELTSLMREFAKDDTGFGFEEELEKMLEE